VVKAGEIIELTTGLPYALGCVLASTTVGGFVLSAPPRVVETANTLLTAALTLGFACLVASTLGAASTSLGAVAAKLRVADYALLLPKPGVTWAAPIFLNLLCFGQAVPLVVERMAASTAGGARPSGAERARAMRRTRTAVLLGSLIPLILSVLWTAVTSSVLAPAPLRPYAVAPDPVLALIASAPAVSIPVTVMAAGAIGTTLIASYLSISQFVADLFCLIFGYCSPRSQRAACVCAVGVPVLVACGGSALYLPLLSFAGAFPTTILYGLLPPLAVLTLRSKAAGGQQAAARWLPGGRAPLLLAAAVALGLLATNAVPVVGLGVAAARKLLL